MAANISTRVEECLVVFTAAESGFLIQESPQNEALSNEFARFKIWVGNLSAHRPTGGRSLEYRLRDSKNLRARVISLLTDLLNELQGLLLSNPSDKIIEDRMVISDDDDDVEMDFEFDEDSPESQCTISDIKGIIDLLYRFALTLRNPAGHTRIRDAISSSALLFKPWDLDHVRSKYPTVSGEVLERLARAMATWRQYIRYREDHYDRKAADLDATDEATTIATSLPNSSKVGSVSMPRQDFSDTESRYTATSYAPTESAATHLRPPPLPDAGLSGEPFQCEICCDIVSMDNEHAWRRHVFEDVPPYICLVTGCLIPNQLYSKRRAWRQHVLKTHHQSWICPFSCTLTFPSSGQLLAHLTTSHGQQGHDPALQGLLESCAVSNDGSLDLHCPLCGKLNASIKIWFKHVGHHLEELACHVLPAKVYGADPEQESASDDANEPLARNEVRMRSITIGEGIKNDDPSSTSSSDEEQPNRTLTIGAQVAKGPEFSSTTPITQPLPRTETNSKRPASPVDLAARFPDLNEITNLAEQRLVERADLPLEHMQGWLGRQTSDRPWPPKLDTNRLVAPPMTKDELLNDESEKFTCSFCLAIFSTQGDLTHHLRSHQPYASRTHVCPTCNKRFQYRKDLVRHLPRHDPNRPRFYCKHAGCKYQSKGFSREDHLDRHLATQHRMES